MNQVRADEFKLKGNAHSDPEDRGPPRRRHIKVAQLAAKWAPPNGSVLDLGCGAGHVVKVLHETRPDVSISIADSYAPCLESTAELAPIDKQYLVDEQSFDVSLITERFDVVILSHVLEHLREPERSVRKVLSLLKPNGVAILAVPNLARPDTIVRAITRRHYVNRGHIMGWDFSHWKNFLEEILKVKVHSYEHDAVQIFPVRITNRHQWLTGIEVALTKPFPRLSGSNIAIIGNSES